MNLRKNPGLRAFSMDQSDVCLSLAKRVMASQGQNTNLVFSPLSINVIVGLIAAGAKGPAQEELLQYLKAKTDQEFNASLSQLVTVLFAACKSPRGPRLSCANGIWVDQRFKLKPRFREIAQDAYKAVTDEVDFLNNADEVVKKVNSWAEKETKGLIKQIFSPGSIDEETRIICANAVYFKGEWEIPFEEEYTTDYKFFLLDGSSVEAPLMANWDWHYISVFDGFKVLRLLYEQGGKDKRQFSMSIFLPDAMDGLHDLVEKATSESGFIERHLPDNREEVEVLRLPKFKIYTEFHVNSILKELGVASIFSSGVSEMVEDETHVSSIMHRAFIEVNETGTEAAAVTDDCEMGYSLYDEVEVKKKIRFVADHPFMFVLREDTAGVVMFVGQVLNPLD